MAIRVERWWGADARPGWTLTASEPAPAADSTGGALSSGAVPITADDATLVSACMAGDRSAFDVIVERHSRAVYQVCYRFAGTHEDASDLSQDVFLRAYRALPRFKGESSLSTWLYRIAVNVSLNHVGARRPATEPIDAERHVDAAGPDPSSDLARAERAARLRAAIVRLPPRQRATLVLRVYRELSHEEISQLLGSSVGAVKANLFHALANLRKLLGSERF